jgi:lipopolysaccharide assembly outer membrane protein LptD (OstA)
MPYAAVVLAFLLLDGSSAAAQTPPAKPLAFPGYTVSDSLDYSAKSIDYNIEGNRAVMHDNATAKYLGYVLKSSLITYYQKDQYVAAEGKRDSTGALAGTPVFTDKDGEELKGRLIEYDLKSGAGVVAEGRTKYDKGFMTFRKVKRVSSDTLFIADGTYTTCDRTDIPHYYFAGKQMKLIVDDKLIIKPITAYMYDIPVFWFPFYVFPISKGRQSGFLTPRYGSSRQDGRYMSNMGYYLAASDFWDYRISGTLRERNGWLTKNWINYNSRYRMSGSVYASFENRTHGTRQWLFRASHAQTVSPTLQIAGDANFQSSQFSRYNSYNIYERLNRDLRSSLTVTKRWQGSGNSLIATATQYKNLDTKNTSSTLPSLSFRKPRALLFGAPGETTIQRKYQEPAEESREKNTEAAPWYRSVYYSFNADFKNTNDSAERSGARDETFTRNMGFSTSLSSSNKVRGWLVTEPSLNLNESFTATNSVSDSLRYLRRDMLTFGLSLGTTVYGTFEPKIGNVTGLRHVITPTATWSVGKNRQYNSGSPEAFLRFDRDESSKNTVNGLDLNLRNLFQMKTVSGEKEKKTDLFTLNFSTSVNFEEEEQKIAPILTTLDVRPVPSVTTRLSASHTLYRADGRFDPLSPTMQQFTLTTDVGLSRESFNFMGASERGPDNSDRGRDDLDIATLKPGAEEGISASRATVPFNLRFSHTFGIRQVYGKPGKYTTAHDIKPEINFSPSPNLSITYFVYYDIEKRQIVSQRASIYRDLHCFEAAVSWIPSGVQEGYYFKVNIKDLPDVKLEKRRGSSGLGY